MLLPLVECLPAIGASRADVENWIRHQELQTTYEPTIPGRARIFSKENVQELAITAAFVRVGFRPGQGIAMAAAARRSVSSGSLREWVVVPAGSTSGVWTDAISPQHIEAATNGAVASAHVVRVGEIVRRVAKLYEVEQ